jgi:hypothetical protein
MGVEQIVNRNGELWTVEYSESKYLTHIGGFLMMSGDLGSITISMQLTKKERRQCQEILSHYLAAMPIGTIGAIMWTPDDMLEPDWEECIRGPKAN